MKRKFKSGDRVKTTPNTLVDYFSTEGADCVGTVVDYYSNSIVLVKFDNAIENRQDLCVFEENLCLLEEDPTE